MLLEQRLPGGRRVGAALRIGALALLGIGAAGPEWGYQWCGGSAFGAEVVLAVDVSASMDVRDVPPSRLEEARREALAVLDQLGGSKVGVVAFAGDARAALSAHTRSQRRAPGARVTLDARR